MPKQPARCPNPECRFHKDPPKGFLRKRGRYKDSFGRLVQRYQCKNDDTDPETGERICGRTFSNRTGSLAEAQRRPDINRMLFGLVCSGITNRRAAKLLDASRTTIESRIAWLADFCRGLHAKAIRMGRLRTSLMHFDEMVGFCHSKAKPVTIAIAVRAKTGAILSAKVGRIPASGKLSSKGREMGWTDNDGPKARAAALAEAALSLRPEPVVVCDSWPTYPAEIAAAIPGARIERHLSRGNAKSQGSHDPMFALNHVCAKIRADIATMARDTWATNKSVEKLQDRLDIYIAWHNGYVRW